jgi:hypothetical protein
LRYKALSAALALLLSVAGPALAADSYTLSLDPVAYDKSTRDLVLGQGRVTATLEGNRLAVSGNFSGLSSPATTVKLGVGLDFGVPATEFFANLQATTGTSGTISGSVTLTPAQIAALNKRQLFLELYSVRGTDGSLWGWFQPAPRTNAPNTARSGR